MQVKILTDSTCDLPLEIMEDLKIETVPLYVIMDEVSYRDGIDMTSEKLIEWSDITKRPPKTSAPSVEDYVKVFKPYVDKKQDIVFVSVTSKLSSTCQNAFLAANTFENANIKVIDGKNITMGTGYIVMKAIEFANDGKGADEIVEKLEEFIPKVKSSFVFDNLEFLKRGGRCSAAKALAASAFKIRPRIDVIDGLMLPVEKYRGTLQKAVKKFCDSVLKDIQKADPEICFVGKTKDDYGLQDFIYEEIKKRDYFKNIYKANTGCIITSHSGANAYAIIYAEK